MSEHEPTQSRAPAPAGNTVSPDGSPSATRRLRGMDADSQNAALDPNQQPGFDAQADALMPGAGLDLRNFGTWTQSGLNAVDRRSPFLARPLVVDGAIGSNTLRGVKGFQAVAPQLVPGAGAVSKHGRLDAGTVWALEQATSSKNPAGRRAEQPVAAVAQAAPQVEAATPEVSEQTVSNGLQGAIQGAAPDLAADAAKVNAAYAAIKAETQAKYNDTTDKDTVRAKANLEVKFNREKPCDEAGKERWMQANFFKAYWSLHCDQFANALMAKINGGGFASLNSLRARTKAAIGAKGGDAGDVGATEVAGRDLRYRRSTMANLGAQLKAENAEVGIGVHIKLRPDSDQPYDPSVEDELHHWFTYVGDGKFSDSFGHGQTGADCDRFMVNWMNRDFHNRGRDKENFDFSFFHTPAWADAGSLAEFHQIMAGAEKPKEAADAMKVTDDDSKKKKKAAMTKARKDEQKTEADKLVKRKKLPKPKGGLQPLVSAIYRPAKARGGR